MGYLEPLVNITRRVVLQVNYTHYFSSGKHCCLWCHITTEELTLAPAVRGPLQLRTDSTLAHDLAAFTTSGANIKRARFFHNVIREPLFTISVDQA